MCNACLLMGDTFDKHINISEMIIGLRPANERWRYFVMTSLIGWVQAYN